MIIHPTALIVVSLDERALCGFDHLKGSSSPQNTSAHQGAAANPYPLRSWGCADLLPAVDHQLSPFARSGWLSLTFGEMKSHPFITVFLAIVGAVCLLLVFLLSRVPISSTGYNEQHTDIVWLPNQATSVTFIQDFRSRIAEFSINQSDFQLWCAKNEWDLRPAKDQITKTQIYLGSAAPFRRQRPIKSLSFQEINLTTHTTKFSLNPIYSTQTYGPTMEDIYWDTMSLRRKPTSGTPLTKHRTRRCSQPLSASLLGLRGPSTGS